jgi:hypothetical protein
MGTDTTTGDAKREGGRTREAQRDPATRGADLPKIDLSTFVLSLSTSALHQLGVVAGPDGEHVETPNRLLAKQTIDTLEMLREKTRGNLDAEETHLFDSLLYELRMRYVATKKG